MKSKYIFSLFLGLFPLFALPVAAQSGYVGTEVAPPPVGTTGDYYQAYTKTIPNARVIRPYGLDVTYLKTSHIIFPSAIRYVDLGSQNIIAAKAEDADNVLRVKAAVKDFETETNMSVICEDGSFYSFSIKYAEHPQKLSVEMQDFLYPGEGRVPSNRADIYFHELGAESPILVKLLMKTIYQNNKRPIKHIGAKLFGVHFTLKSLYAHNGLLYFETQIQNDVAMPYNIDFIEFRIVDKKTSKHTAIQEQVLQPLRGYNQIGWIKPWQSERIVFALEQFSLPDNKELRISLYERNGGRTITMSLQQEDLLLARMIDNLKLKF